jgi:Ca-activated chloride channel family protein
MFGLDLDLTFAHPELVHLTWAAAAVVVLLGWLELHRRDVLERFVSAVMQRRLAERPTTGRILARLGLVFVALVAGVLGLMRPQTRGVTETISSSKVSADIMIVLDVSKSMLAGDTAPSRLERAKAEIDEMLDRLTGHRVGLVAFAGRAVQLCPLTSDYAFFRMVLRETDVGSVARGGTRIGDGLRKGLTGFDDGDGAKLVVLITDGEDHESYPLDAAKEVKAAGVRVVAIGFGSEQGSPIMVPDPVTKVLTAVIDKDTNQPVSSRLDGETLRQIALETEGAYVPAGTSALDLDSIIASHVQPILRERADASVRVVPGELYPWFVMAALVCIVLAAWFGATVSPPDTRRMPL